MFLMKAKHMGPLSFISKYCNIYHDRYIYTLDYHDKLFWIEYFQKIGFQM